MQMIILLRTNASEMEVDKNIFPVLFGRAVYFVVDAQMRVRSRNAIPPVPCLAMDRRMSKVVYILNAAEVAADHEAI